MRPFPHATGNLVECVKYNTKLKRLKTFSLVSVFNYKELSILIYLNVGLDVLVWVGRDILE